MTHTRFSEQDHNCSKYLVVYSLPFCHIVSTLVEGMIASLKSLPYLPLDVHILDRQAPVVMFRSDDSLGVGGGPTDEYDDFDDGGFNATHDLRGRPPLARAGLNMR